jgi:hypothetical protein
MIRDDRTKALINTDADALYKYKMERDKTRKMISMENELNSLKERVDILYKLLEDRVEKNNGKVINN